MISDLSSKLSAYINGEQSDQSSQTRDPADIEDVLAAEIKPAETFRKQPGDELFTDLSQALDSHSDARDEKSRKQRLAEEQRQRQRAEDARRHQLRNEQLRQQKLREEQLRQQKLREEQLRQQKLQEEQQRQLKLREEQLRQQKLREEQFRQQKLQEEQLKQQRLRRERALARSLAESLYMFDPDQPFTSVRSGHPVNFSKLNPSVRSAPSEEAMKKALAKMAATDKAAHEGTSYESRETETYYEAPRAETYYEAPRAETYYEAPKAAARYEASEAELHKVPQRESSYDVPPAAAFPETPASETVSASFFDESSQSAGESKYAQSPDPLYKGYQTERRGGSRIVVIIALLVAILAVAAVFIMIRRYSSNLTNLLTGAPAAGTTDTASDTTSDAESKSDSDTGEESRAAVHTDSSAAVESQTAASMAVNEEGEIFHTDSRIAETEDSVESIPEDPNDISYLASVNQKEAEDAIAELSEAAPRLYLSTYGIKIGAGDSFNALSYVERIEDDADDRDRLFRDISVDGLGEFDAKVPGTYELTYFCYDSAGNRSNRAKLTVIVE